MCLSTKCVQRYIVEKSNNVRVLLATAWYRLSIPWKNSHTVCFQNVLVYLWNQPNNIVSIERRQSGHLHNSATPSIHCTLLDSALLFFWKYPSQHPEYPVRDLVETKKRALAAHSFYRITKCNVVWSSGVVGRLTRLGFSSLSFMRQEKHLLMSKRSVCSKHV